MADKKAGKKGTRQGGKRPRGARGTGANVVAFIGAMIAGFFTAEGAGAVSNGVIGMARAEEGKPAPEPLHPALEGALDAVSGALVTGAQAVAKPLRKHALPQLIGNGLAGVGKVILRVATKPKAAGRNVADQLKRKRMADQRQLPAGSGQSAREQMLEAARN